MCVSSGAALSWSRASTYRWHVALLAAASSACIGGHRVDLEFHTPRMCEPTDADASSSADAGVSVEACPLRAVRSLRTRIERVDGTVAHSACQRAPDDFCSLRDLRDFLFVPRITPSDGVDIRLTGWTDTGCSDVLVLDCESFGVGVIDLAAVDVVPLFCECPYVTSP